MVKPFRLKVQIGGPGGEIAHLKAGPGETQGGQDAGLLRRNLFEGVLHIGIGWRAIEGVQHHAQVTRGCASQTVEPGLSACTALPVAPPPATWPPGS